MNDMRLLLEEQTSRNTLLEKKQKKFDSELAMVSFLLFLQNNFFQSIHSGGPDSPVLRYSQYFWSLHSTYSYIIPLQHLSGQT